MNNNLINGVIKNGYCIGCGVCTQIENSPFFIERNKLGQNQASLKSNFNELLPHLDSKLKNVCPFSGESLNEDEIGKDLFKNVKNYNPLVGYFCGSYAGYAKEYGAREVAASGGLTTWLLIYLLENKFIDGIIHVRPTNEPNNLFKYQISKSVHEILEGAKSKYYPVELSEVLEDLKLVKGKFAIVGTPCFIKAIRLLTKSDKELDGKIKYCIGLVCGHLKSDFFAKMFGWYCGINPNNLKSIDFRTKLEGQSSNNYGVTVSDGIQTKISLPISKLYGTNWGYGFFKYKACDYCDDVLAETADIVLGDAWLPRYHTDSRGTNVVVVRNRELDDTLKDAVDKNRIHLDILPIEEIIKSQQGGFNHRRDGLSIRLYNDKKENRWVPQKRVLPKVCDSKNLLKKHLSRPQIREKSLLFFKEALDKNDFNYFINNMKPYTNEYDTLYKVSFMRRVVNKVRSEITKLQSR